jgi:hypothetical protein
MNQKQEKADSTIPIIYPDESIDKTQIFSIDSSTNNSNDDISPCAHAHIGPSQNKHRDIPI